MQRLGASGTRDTGHLRRTSDRIDECDVVVETFEIRCPEVDKADRWSGVEPFGFDDG
jgi:hypothetical protein